MVYQDDDSSTDLAWAVNTFGPLHSQERFLFYGTGGLLDPKNYTVEPWALSGGGSAKFWNWDKARWRTFGTGFIESQTIAFVGVGYAGAIFDPLGKFEGEGLDEVIGDVYDWKRQYTTQSRKHQREWGLGYNIRIG